ncbi:MAG: hypothetical protein O2954_21055 [bacterium]|nr:hypothetical protein [bacterium]
MKAAWDWHLPTETEAQQREVVEFAAELGFDTLIIRNVTEPMVRRGKELGVRVVAILYAGPSEALAKEHPECLQQVLPAEEAFVSALSEAPGNFQHVSHRWFPLVLDGKVLCFEHEASQEELRERIRKALALADGVAFDGFGFRNHYGCFCERCVQRRTESAAAHPDLHEAEVMARVSERSLVDASWMLYDYAKSVKPDAVVTNHVWPPFQPDWYYGCKLRLDYCTQTISWFYRPHWSLERVKFEAEEHKRLEDPKVNTFVPFIGLYADPYLVRTPERVRAEFDVAQEYGHVVLCNLEAPKQYGEIAAVVKEAMGKM